jgi:hypothetical protein
MKNKERATTGRRDKGAITKCNMVCWMESGSRKTTLEKKLQTRV